MVHAEEEYARREHKNRPTRTNARILLFMQIALFWYVMSYTLV